MYVVHAMNEEERVCDECFSMFYCEECVEFHS